VRILANENVAGDVIEELRHRGHDVVWIRVVAPGSPDDAVLSLAREQQCVLSTFEKDFGELVFGPATRSQQPEKTSCGV
jgi:hypothetical protein